MTNEERASATSELQPHIMKARDRAVQIKELFSALNTLGSYSDEAFAFSTLANKGADLANEIVNELKQIR